MNLKKGMFKFYDHQVHFYLDDSFTVDYGDNMKAKLVHCFIHSKTFSTIQYLIVGNQTIFYESDYNPIYHNGERIQ